MQIIKTFEKSFYSDIRLFKSAFKSTAIPIINERMSNVKRKILILSGKGGVGKSTFTSQLAFAFAEDENTQVSL